MVVRLRSTSATSPSASAITATWSPRRPEAARWQPRRDSGPSIPRASRILLKSDLSHQNGRSMTATAIRAWVRRCSTSPATIRGCTRFIVLSISYRRRRLIITCLIIIICTSVFRYVNGVYTFNLMARTANFFNVDYLYLQISLASSSTS